VLVDESRLSRSVTFDLGGEAQKANIIAHQAARDSDDFVAASKRHDRDFLHDVATKLVRRSELLCSLITDNRHRSRGVGYNSLNDARK